MQRRGHAKHRSYQGPSDPSDAHPVSLRVSVRRGLHRRVGARGGPARLDAHREAHADARHRVGARRGRARNHRLLHGGAAEELGERPRDESRPRQPVSARAVRGRRCRQQPIAPAGMGACRGSRRRHALIDRGMDGRDARLPQPDRRRPPVCRSWPMGAEDLVAAARRRGPRRRTRRSAAGRSDEAAVDRRSPAGPRADRAGLRGVRRPLHAQGRTALGRDTGVRPRAVSVARLAVRRPRRRGAARARGSADRDLRGRDESGAGAFSGLGTRG